jgi:[FeFe] hydrogenase H-cluster maturation GTPase HydF
MENTPRGLRRHIALFGKTNAGKSTLFNLLTGQENAIVADKPGTTTDPVFKNMELLPFGPVVLIDTAGLFDESKLGAQRMKKTLRVARRADVGVFLVEAAECSVICHSEQGVESTLDAFGDTDFFTGEKIFVLTKADLITPDMHDKIKGLYPDAILVAENDTESIQKLKDTLTKILNELDKNESDTLIGDLLPAGSTVVMVVKVDSEAPKGRLILPQVQLLRDCLDHGMRALVVREIELESALNDLPKVDLVVTDSQIFTLVDQIVPKEIPLTSFSILLARQKGNFEQLLAGAEALKDLNNNDRILMLEACTHSHGHEDIGRVKIPAALGKFTGKKLYFEFFSGYDIPEQLGGYALAIMCGSCMINKKEMASRLALLEERGIPATNYGVVLAYVSGILDRCVEIDSSGKPSE